MKWRKCNHLHVTKKVYSLKYWHRCRDLLEPLFLELTELNIVERQRFGAASVFGIVEGLDGTGVANPDGL